MNNLIHNPTPYLICDGNASGEQHVTPVPRIDTEHGVGGPMLCTECGSWMFVVDLITVERRPDWSSCDRYRQVRRYYS